MSTDTPRTDAATEYDDTAVDEVKDFARTLERELAEAEAYADRLADSLREGTLPKDVEVLREANAGLAAENDTLRAEVEAFKANNRYMRGHTAGYNEAKDKCEAELMHMARRHEAEVAQLREDKARLDWLERWIMSFSALTAPDMGGIRFCGQCHNPAKERGEAGPSYLRFQGRTVRQAIDAARNA